MERLAITIGLYKWGGVTVYPGFRISWRMPGWYIIRIIPKTHYFQNVSQPPFMITFSPSSTLYNLCSRRDSAVSTVTNFLLDNQSCIHGKGSSFVFPAAFRMVLGPIHPPTQRLPGAFSLGVRWLQR
jgi:hypothetical protein